MFHALCFARDALLITRHGTIGASHFARSHVLITQLGMLDTLFFFQGITWFRLVPGPACCVSRSLAPPNAVNTRVYGPGSVAGLVGPFPHYHKPCLEAHFLRRASPKHLGYAKLLQRSPAQPPSKTLLWFPPQCTISKSWRRYTGTSYDVSEAWRSDNERPIALDSKLLALLAGTHGLMCQAKFEEDLYYARHFGALF